MFLTLLSFKVSEPPHPFFSDPTVSLFPDVSFTGSSTNSSNLPQPTSNPTASLLDMDPTTSLLDHSSFDPSPPALCRTTRVSLPSTRLKDFHDYSTIVSQYEPRNYREANSDPLW